MRHSPAGSMWFRAVALAMVTLLSSVPALAQNTIDCSAELPAEGAKFWVGEPVTITGIGGRAPQSSWNVNMNVGGTVAGYSLFGLDSRGNAPVMRFGVPGRVLLQRRDNISSPFGIPPFCFIEFDILPPCPTPVPEPIPQGMRPILESVGGGGSWLTLDNSASYNPPAVIRNAGNYPLTIYDVQQVFQDGLVEIKVTNLHALREIPPGETRHIEFAAYTLQGRAGKSQYRLAIFTNDPQIPNPNYSRTEEFLYAQTATGIPTSALPTATPIYYTPGPSLTPTCTIPPYAHGEATPTATITPTATPMHTTGTLTLTASPTLSPSLSATPTATPMPTPCGDVDGNGVVDAADLIIRLLGMR